MLSYLNYALVLALFTVGPTLDTKTSKCYETVNRNSLGVVIAEQSLQPIQATPIQEKTQPELKIQITSEEYNLVKRPDAKNKIIDNLPQNLTSQDKAKLEVLVEQSLSALKAGDNTTSVRKIEEARAITRRLGKGGSSWENCGDHCQHHLDDGNAVAYAVCYWACVIRGGSEQLQLHL